MLERPSKGGAPGWLRWGRLPQLAAATVLALLGAAGSAPGSSLLAGGGAEALAPACALLLGSHRAAASAINERREVFCFALSGRCCE